MSADHWTEVDRYFHEHLIGRDPALDAAIEASEAADLPAIQVSPLQGKLLMLLARAQRARTILELGTLGGYSTIWLARALPADGQITTLELESRHAAVARANIELAGFDDQVEVLVGPASQTLALLIAEQRPPFDFIFIDADKPGYPDYLDALLKLARPGTMIVADNVVRAGAVTDAASADTNVQGIRRFTEKLAANPRLDATVVQTVGAKGHDGFACAVVKG